MDAAELTTHPTVTLDRPPEVLAGFAELFGLPVTVSRIMTVVAGLFFVIALVALGLLYSRDRQAQLVTPFLVSFDDVGRPKIVSVATTVEISDVTLRYMLKEFVITHLSRNRATLDRDFTRSLYFLNQSFFDGPMDEAHRLAILSTFAKDGGKLNMDIVVKNVTLLDMNRSPFRALVDIEQQFSGRDSKVVTAIQKATVVLEFTRKTQVQESVKMENPLGLQIESIRVDAAL